MKKLLAGKKSRKKYQQVPLDTLVGKMVEAISQKTVDGAWGQEPCIVLHFTDGTEHRFVLPTEE